METSSVDGKRDLLIGLLFVIFLSVVGYIALTNISVILDNALPIIVVAFGIGLVFTVVPHLFDIILGFLDYFNLIKNADDSTVRDPEMPSEDEDSTQTIDLEIRDPPAKN